LAAGLLAAVLGAAPASAQNQNQNQNQNQDQNQNQNQNAGARSVPEFDPAAIGVIGALVAGGGVLLARRGRKR
jgi:hypothetical protein